MIHRKNGDYSIEVAKDYIITAVICMYKHTYI